MADFYSQMAEMTRDLLAPTSQGGLGQGEIKLSRTTTIPPVNPWDVPETKQVTINIKGAVRGIDTKLVGVEMGGTVLLASDRVAITEVPSIDYRAGDTLTVDGKPVVVIDVEKIPAAGVASAVKFYIRG